MATTTKARNPMTLASNRTHVASHRGTADGQLVGTFGRTTGMALVGLKVVRSDGAPIGITGAYARAFGSNYLIRALTTPLRRAGPTAYGGAMIVLDAANAAAALLDPEHRTLWNRLAGTRVVRA